MFLESLKIESESKIIQNIRFRKGINLIVDETINHSETATGNNVGKTTILKLIDYCLGGNAKPIYTEQEHEKQEYKLVKEFLIKNKVLVTLILTADLDNPLAYRIKIERNFLSRKEIIRRINEEDITEDDFNPTLQKLLLPKHMNDKPTFRQIISHNFRYKDESINNTLKTLDKFTTLPEYEALHLYMFGCAYNDGGMKQQITLKVSQEETYKKRLEKTQTKTAYATALELIENDICELNEKKSNFNLDKNFENNLEALNRLRYDINKTSSKISSLTIRQDLILEAQNELHEKKSNIDLVQIHQIYQQALQYINPLQKTFDELVSYHNNMLEEKIKYITNELPSLTQKISYENSYLQKLLEEEKILSVNITKIDSFEDLEKIITALNEKYRLKGEYENILKQISETEDNISEYMAELDKINESLFSYDFEHRVQKQLNKFNTKYFSQISNTLYGNDEQYAIKYDIRTYKRTHRVYEFSSFNTNLSSGKKQGEISCFDIAYTLFADDEGIDCMHFILNDKKELMHDNQLVKIAKLADEKNVQFVASILKDKLPIELNQESNFIIKLSPDDKLFRIESSL